MKPLYLVAVSTLALTAAACTGGPPPQRAALECPQAEGDLTRTSAAADGKTCTYTSAGGAEVTLQLVSAPGGPDAALSAIETNLLAERAKPEAAATPAATDAEAAKPTADAAKPAADAKAAASDAEQAAREAAADTKGVDVKIEVSKDGTVVSRTGGSEVTRVDLPGIHIVANEDDDTAKVQVGPIKIDAGGDGATIRIRRDVRLRGEALNPEKRGLRATFIYAGEDLAGGYRFVGYEAGGPKRGPITVAVVKSKTEEPDEGDLHRDVKRLVRKNGGV